ncbi:MAG TPA: N-acetylmuramoyl-L-alanine amidase, partial [Chitinophagaceae bacterium]|nr:N-acetylmuramoyl-L-alanine amidase [Chitinophagaceae bacterium]
MGRTIGPLPYLEYGEGDDRLGGAKMGYLDTNVVMKVVDSLKTDYKVQLSKNHFAWLPKANFRPDTGTHLRPYYLTSSWRVYGDDKYDYVTVALDARLPYRSMHQVSPSRIVVDVFGATSNTNWITQLLTAKEIKNVYYEQLEDDVFRVIIELKHKQHWGHFIYYAGNRLTVRIRRQPSKPKLKNLLIAIDAGHGGSNTGAAGVSSKIKEKDYTLLFAKQLEKALKRKNAQVFMTRTGDVDLTMIDRTLMIREQ